MKVKFKRLNHDAQIPTKAHTADAGFDLYATSRVFDSHGTVTYGTGIAMEIPDGYVGLVFPRSSVSKYDLNLSNSVGVIDSCYRGEITLKFRPTLMFAQKGYYGKDENDYEGIDDTELANQEVTFNGRNENYPDIPYGNAPFAPRCYEIGERIGQIIIIPYPEIEFELADELSETDRGNGGYGSTGA